MLLGGEHKGGGGEAGTRAALSVALTPLRARLLLIQMRGARPAYQRRAGNAPELHAGRNGKLRHTLPLTPALAPWRRGQSAPHGLLSLFSPPLSLRLVCAPLAGL